MEKIVAAPERTPKFSLLAGIGAIVVYLTSSLPFIAVVAAMKTIELQSGDSSLTSSEISTTVQDLVKSPGVLIGALVVQCICLFIYVWGVSFVRGTRNPFRDFGLRFSRRSPLFFLLGVALQGVGLLISIPIQLLRDGGKEQEIVDSFRHSSGLNLIVFMVLVAFVVPVAEEVCFRGVFMRGLGKKVSPYMAVVITGTLFAFVHLGDPSAFYGLATLLIFGILASGLAMYRGKIDASIFMHMGFNFTTVVLIVLARNF